MKFELDKQTASFLLGLVNRPQILPFNDMSQNFKPYAASDEPGGRQLAALKRWAQKKLIPALEQHRDNKEDEVVFKGGLKQAYVDRVLEVLVHYKPMGLLVQCAEPYIRLKAVMEGKTYEVDDPSEDGDEDQ